MKKIKFIALGAVLLACVAVVSGFYVSYAAVAPEEGKICDGVYIDSVNVGGMTEEEARAALDSYAVTLKDKTIELKLSDGSITATLEEMGFTFAENEYIQEAMNLGKTGSILNRYTELKDVQNGKKVFTMTYAVDAAAFDKFVQNKCVKYCEPAENAGIKRVNGEFVYTDAKKGHTVDQEATIEAIQQALQQAKGSTEVSATAVIKEDDPKYGLDVAQKCNTRLGSFSTTYSMYQTARCKNLANAASLINGTIVYPGETFSVYGTISPIEISNGYALAASYENGEVVETPGGGVCQVSTTLYNAVLRAELDVVERSPHSMRVSYVPLSMDAAIAGTYKDMKFKNNTDAPLYIEGYAGGGTISFTIYGHETRPEGRTIRFESETTSEIQPGEDKVTKDPTQPESYLKVTQSAHVGATAKLWKYIKEGGVEKKVLVNESRYAAVPRYVIKGTKKKDDKDKVDKDKNKDDKPKASATPKPTSTPKATATPKPSDEPTAE